MKSIVLVNSDGTRNIINPLDVEKLELLDGQVLLLDGKEISLAELKRYIKNLLANSFAAEGLEVLANFDPDKKISILDVEGEEVLFLGEDQAAAAGIEVNPEGIETGYILEDEIVDENLDFQAELENDLRDLNQENEDTTRTVQREQTRDYFATSAPTGGKIEVEENTKFDGTRTNDTTPTITIDLPEGTQVGDIATLYNGNEVLATKVITQEDIDNGTVSLTPNNPLTDGNYSLSVTITDQSGNESEKSEAINLIIDTVATDAPQNQVPSATDDNGNAIDDKKTNDNTPTLNVILPEDTNVGDVVTIYDGTTPVGTKEVSQEDKDNGKIEVTVEEPLEDGEHKLTTTITDEAGNESENSEETTIIVDTTATNAPEKSTATNDAGEDITGKFFR